nr:hypothetical protein [uncultured Caproiciproducens sp.]
MWLSQQMIAAQKRQTAAEVTEVTGTTVMQGANEYRSVPLLGPWGIAYLPPNSAQTVVIGTNAGNACIGAVAGDKGILPGELMLFSSGGASIYLKNSGEVVINGQTFAAREGS